MAVPFARRMRRRALVTLVAVALLTGLLVADPGTSPPARAQVSSQTQFQREMFLCVANALTMSALGGGASVAAVQATRWILVRRAYAAARSAQTLQAYTDAVNKGLTIQESVRVTASTVLPSVATSFVTTCAGGFTLFFYKGLAEKIFPDDAQSGLTPEQLQEQLLQNNRFACRTGTLQPSLLCFEESTNEYYTAGGQLVGDSVCARVPGAYYEEFSGLCRDDNAGFYQPDGTAMGTCAVGTAVGVGVCAKDDTVFAPDGMVLSPADSAAGDACVRFVLGRGSADDCTPLLADSPPVPTPAPAPAPPTAPMCRDIGSLGGGNVTCVLAAGEWIIADETTTSLVTNRDSGAYQPSRSDTVIVYAIGSDGGSVVTLGAPEERQGVGSFWPGIGGPCPGGVINWRETERWIAVTITRGSGSSEVLSRGAIKTHYDEQWLQDNGCSSYEFAYDATGIRVEAAHSRPIQHGVGLAQYYGPSGYGYPTPHWI